MPSIKRKNTLVQKKQRRRRSTITRNKKRKYTLKSRNRNSPINQANSSNCRGKIKKGKDGKKYKSISIMQNGKQVYVWRKHE